MSGRRGLSAIKACSSCRFSILNTFVALSESSIAPISACGTRAIALPTRINSLQRTQKRCFAAQTRSRTEEKANPELHPPSQDLDNVELAVAEQSDPRPWYLRVQDEQEFEHTPLERQKLPDIPPDSPEILTDVVDHLSRDIGLDYLTLMDLREIDPPPALGGNLIMIIGTARSEKHLNVAADRFSRWLRSKYKLKPTADGLLGRNELKIKLRRKARHAKLLGGKSQTRQVDDGISTGWICVNAGPITEGEKRDVIMKSDEEGVTGFGQVDDRVRLVVQLLTEERRAELALEDLWDGYMDKQRRRREKHGREEDLDIGGAKKMNEAETDAMARDNSSGSTPLFDVKTRKASASVSGMRYFSSMSRVYQIAQSATAAARPLGMPPSTTTGMTHGKDKFPVGQAVEYNRDLSPLRNTLRYLQSLSPEAALEALGEGYQDRYSTSFLRDFHNRIGLFPGPEEFRARLVLVDYGRQLGHPKYTTANLLAVLHEMEETCINIPASCYHIVLKALGSEKIGNLSDHDSDSGELQRLETMLELLENMTLRKLPTITKPTIDSLMSALWNATISDSRGSRTKISPSAASDTLLLAIENDVPITDDESHILAMQEVASIGDWTKFWEIWQSFPIRELPRSSRIYAAMFRLVAASQHEAMCLEAVTTWIDEMRYERPQVKLEGHVALAVMACLKVIDSSIDHKVVQRTDTKDKLVQLFGRCFKALRPE